MRGGGERRVERETQRQEEKLRAGEKWSWGEEGGKLEREPRGTEMQQSPPPTHHLLVSRSSALT